MKHNTAAKDKAHLKPEWNELFDIKLNLPKAEQLNDSMCIEFKVVDVQGSNSNEIGKSYIPIRNFLTPEYKIHEKIKLQFNNRDAGTIDIETSF